MRAMSKRTRASLWGGVIGAIGGYWITWSTTLFVGIDTGGLEGSTWAVEAASMWQFAGMFTCALLGTRLPKRMEAILVWHMSWLLFANWASVIGCLVGEYVREYLEQAKVHLLRYEWNPWPGGCGMVAGILLGYLLFRAGVRHEFRS